MEADHHCRAPQFDAGNPLAEASIRRAFWLTTVMMIVEIAGGWWFNSMAVLADGWHMSSHSLALGLSAFAYSFARKQAGHRRGTQRQGELACAAVGDLGGSGWLCSRPRLDVA